MFPIGAFRLLFRSSESVRVRPLTSAGSRENWELPAYSGRVASGCDRWWRPSNSRRCRDASWRSAPRSKPRLPMMSMAFLPDERPEAGEVSTYRADFDATAAWGRRGLKRIGNLGEQSGWVRNQQGTADTHNGNEFATPHGFTTARSC